jgi:hypothetical protein
MLVVIRYGGLSRLVRGRVCQVLVERGRKKRHEAMKLGFFKHPCIIWN